MPGKVRLHRPLLHPLLRPPSNHNRNLGEVVELARGLVLEIVLEVGDAPTQPTGAGSPSRSLSHLVAREQAAPFPVPEPARLGGRLSLAINDLPGLRKDDLEGTLKLGNYTVAGRLSHFQEAWSKITTDRWVLEIVKNGYALPFTAPPPMAREPLETPLPVLPLKREALWTEVQSLLDKGAIEEIPLGDWGWGYNSHCFLATKRTGGFHPILNLRGLNASSWRSSEWKPCLLFYEICTRACE